MTQVVQAEPPRRWQWVWFRNEPGGRPLPREELDSLDVAGRAGLVKAMERYRDGQTGGRGVRSLGDGLFELQRIGLEDREIWASVLAMQSSENTSSKLMIATWALVAATVGIVVATIVLVLVTVAKP
jgi:hypothetical protein